MPQPAPATPAARPVSPKWSATASSRGCRGSLMLLAADGSVELERVGRMPVLGGGDEVGQVRAVF
ncbi:hypothetical protein [Streptomyces bungoensis]|uniref:hypothetical protein n=1 Tax=Streptomyces bungoensis TaxID=285568 RepID=UPI00131E0A2B|nr:hypothetical protein [Streptomyces bungoensis]